MTYTIEKARPIKKEKKEQEELRRKIDPMFAVFGQPYLDLIKNKNIII